MIETYQYEIRNNRGNKDYKIETRIEYDTKNSYNVTNYFFNGKTWDKDFIDITHNLPTEPSAKKEYEEFMTRIHDFMVHGNFQETLKKMEDNTSQIIKAYKLEVTSHKI